MKRKILISPNFWEKVTSEEVFQKQMLKMYRKYVKNASLK